MALPIRSAASHLETYLGDFFQNPTRKLRSCVDTKRTNRGIRLAEKLNGLFEDVVIGRECARIDRQDVFDLHEQCVTLSNRSASLELPHPLGTAGDTTWILVDTKGICVGESLDTLNVYHVSDYEPQNPQHRALASACIKALKVALTTSNN